MRCGICKWFVFYLKSLIICSGVGCKKVAWAKCGSGGLFSERWGEGGGGESTFC